MINKQKTYEVESAPQPSYLFVLEFLLSEVIVTTCIIPAFWFFKNRVNWFILSCNYSAECVAYYIQSHKFSKELHLFITLASVSSNSESNESLMFLDFFSTTGTRVPEMFSSTVKPVVGCPCTEKHRFFFLSPNCNILELRPCDKGRFFALQVLKEFVPIGGFQPSWFLHFHPWPAYC